MGNDAAVYKGEYSTWSSSRPEPTVSLLVTLNGFGLGFNNFLPDCFISWAPIALVLFQFYV